MVALPISVISSTFQSKYAEHTSRQILAKTRCVYMYLCICTFVYVCVNASMYVCMNVCECFYVCMYVCM